MSPEFQPILRKLNHTNKMIHVVPMAVSILIAELAGVVGSLFTTPNISIWYGELAKPAWNPPAWVFAPVWTTLFALMGIAAALIWGRRHSDHRVPGALRAYALSLVLNIGWSAIFFGLHRPGWALVDLIALWVTIMMTIIRFRRMSHRAAGLLVPYLLWVSFAGVLNFSIWRLNP